MSRSTAEARAHLITSIVADARTHLHVLVSLFAYVDGDKISGETLGASDDDVRREFAIAAAHVHGALRAINDELARHVEAREHDAPPADGASNTILA